MDQIKIKNFATQIEAELAKNFLEARGIKSVIQNLGVTANGLPSDRFGVDLSVLEKDAEEARELLN